MSKLRILIVAAGLVLLWALFHGIFEPPPYILPGPLRVLEAFLANAGTIARHAVITFSEIIAGLVIGAALGTASALIIAASPATRRWILPVLVASQAIPVFALAPVLVLWLGYGMPSKIAMATLIIYFPVTVAFLDGLNRTERGWVDLARTMTAGSEMHPFRRRLAILAQIRIPAALPGLASGLRVATAVAPIGAVVGEWVGSSQGLGYLMLHANGRVQIDLLFAALATLAVIAVTLYFAVDALLARAIPWEARDRNQS